MQSSCYFLRNYHHQTTLFFSHNCKNQTKKFNASKAIMKPYLSFLSVASSITTISSTCCFHSNYATTKQSQFLSTTLTTPQYYSSLATTKTTLATRRRNSFDKVPLVHLSSLSSDKTGSVVDKVQEKEGGYATSYHAPVMLQECIDALLKKSHNASKKNKYSSKEEEKEEGKEEEKEERRGKVFIDGTLGGGGHSHYLLQQLSKDDVVIGCDVDPSALTTASNRLRQYIILDKQQQQQDMPIFIPIQSNFKDLTKVVKNLKHPITGELILSPPPKSNNDVDESSTYISSPLWGVDGILLDLGVSSHQIDTMERGFAFMKDGPLDMRMKGGDWKNYNNDNDNEDQKDDLINVLQNKNNNNSNYGLTAADICNEFAKEDLMQMFKKFANEPTGRAKQISQSIINARPLKTTGDLKEAVSKVTPKFSKKSRRLGQMATLARIFQSLRIVVNEEDYAVQYALEEMAPCLVRRGGRLVVLSYHSLEDRVVKRVMRDGGMDRRANYYERDVYGNEINDDDTIQYRPWKVLGKKQKASEKEIESNKRARSAMLRVSERL